LVWIAKKSFNEITVSKDSYKIKGKYFGDTARFETTIELSKVDDSTICIEFNRKTGEVVSYYNKIDEYFKTPINKLVEKVSASIKQTTTTAW